jgi:hypothetical protein
MRQVILEVAGIPDSQHFDKYLGLPTLVGRSKIYGRIPRNQDPGVEETSRLEA